METLPPVESNFTLVIVTLGLFAIAAIVEIGGGYLVWLWLREKRKLVIGLIGGTVLFLYGIIPTFQPSNFGRIYAAYGGIFIIMSLVWGLLIDKRKPDRYEIIGGITALSGAIIIFYAPR